MNKRVLYIVILVVVCLAGQFLLKPLCAKQAPAAGTQPAPADKSLTESENPAAGETPSDPESPRPRVPFMDKQGGPDDLRSDLVRQLVTMVVFITFAGGAVWWGAKHYRKKQLSGGGRRIRVSESVSLGPRKTLHLVEVDSRRLLIGTAPDRITFLSDLTESPAPREFKIPDLNEGDLE